MKNLQKFGGIAAIYLALAHLIGITIFIVILDYMNITDTSQKILVNINNQKVVYATNLIMYVFFGFFLIVLMLALYDRLKSGASALMQIAAAIGIIWAGSLIASGMVANAGLAAIVPLYAQDPAQATITWQGIEAVANGLGNANGEILGGLMTLLVSLAALRTHRLPAALSVLGLIVGTIGIITLLPTLNPFVSIFGVGQIIWFIWLGIVLRRSKDQEPTKFSAT